MRNQIGLIAEEVNQLIPEIIGRDKNGVIYNVDYPKLTVVLIKGMQEQQTQIISLKDKLNKLCSFADPKNLSGGC